MGWKKGRRKAKLNAKRQAAKVGISPNGSIRETSQILDLYPDLRVGEALVNILLNSTPLLCPLKPKKGKFGRGLGNLALRLALEVRGTHKIGESPPICQLCPHRECRLRFVSYQPLEIEEGG